MPFTAINEKEVKVRAKKGIPTFKDGAIYHCENPECQKEMRARVNGNHRIPHFYHVQSNPSCFSWYEKDSKEHFKAINVIQNLLGISDKDLEFWVKNIRADLLFQNRYALEIQFSPISDQKIAEKNAIYISRGYIPVWIFFTSNKKLNYRIKVTPDGKKSVKPKHFFASCLSGPERIAPAILEIVIYQTHMIFVKKHNLNFEFYTTRLIPIIGTKYSFEQDPYTTFDLVNVDQFDYIFRMIAKRYSHYRALQDVPEFMKNAWYLFDELLDKWVLHKIAARCSKCGRFYWDDPDLHSNLIHICPNDCEESDNDPFQYCYENYTKKDYLEIENEKPMIIHLPPYSRDCYLLKNRFSKESDQILDKYQNMIWKDYEKLKEWNFESIMKLNEAQKELQPIICKLEDLQFLYLRKLKKQLKN